MFWGWVHDRLNSPLAVAPTLHDIQELNRLAIEHRDLEFTKVSMATFLHPLVRENYRLVSSGAALGRGCGPLVVSKSLWDGDRPLRLAIPGRDTTACKLAEMALGQHVSEWVELRYDEIMPAVVDGSQVDAGVIIHESRFVYHRFGLNCAFDLGEWWETETGLPLPLGLMVAHKKVEPEVVHQAEESLRNSILLSQEIFRSGSTHPLSASLWKYLRTHAIELEDETMSSHIALYVNDFSVELGTEGRAAVGEFERRALGV